MSAGRLEIAGTGPSAMRLPEPLAEALRRDGVGDMSAVSPFAACLVPLLDALGFKGGRRRVSEALPHLAQDLDLVELRGVLAELGFPTTPLEIRLSDLDPGLAPCLFVSRDGRPMVVVEPRGSRALVLSPGSGEAAEIGVGALRGTAYVVAPRLRAEAPADEPRFMRALAARFRPLFWQLAATTLLVDAVTLAGSLAAILVYDKVIATRATDFLAHLCAGLFALFACDAALRALRARAVAYVAARIDRLVGAATLRQLLALPLSMTENVAVGVQVARLREFEGIREFFTGPLAQLLLEIPFVAIAIVALAWVAGPLALVPLAVLLLFVLAGWLALGPVNRAIAAASRARAHRQAFLVEMLAGMGAIRHAGAEGVWLERYRNVSAETAALGDRAQRLSLLLQTTSQLVVLAAAVACLALGIGRVLAGTMTIGALVATMAILWRVTSPLQAMLVLLPRAEQVLRTLAHVDALMRLKPARAAAQPRQPALADRQFRGDLRAARVSHRYRAEGDPAIMATDFSAKAGEVVAVVGASGSGKSTLLRILAGAYQPQSGAVTVDGVDIRQLPPGDLQRAISYLPQACHFFHGTIEQNLRLADPLASDEALRAALSDAGALDEVMALRNGLDTKLGDQRTAKLPAGLVQRLALARALLSRAPVLLLDEPGQSFDERGDAALRALLPRLRGERTVVMVTHRPSHMRLCDRVVVLQEGRVAREMPAAEFLGMMMKGSGR
jgi:ATP-binding cassette subfamily C protein/ATP-binding cassette subfamily C protein LapB